MAPNVQDGADADGILVDQADGLLRIDDIAVLGAEDVLLLDVEVARRFPVSLVNDHHPDNVGTGSRVTYSQQTCTAEFMTIFGRE